MAFSKQKMYRLILTLFSLILLIAVYLFIKNQEPNIIYPNTSKQTAPAIVQSVLTTQKKYDLQPTIDKWVASQGAEYGIVVYDPHYETIIGSHGGDTPYFAASLYKLYIAYLTLMDFQSSAQNPNEVLLNGQTKRQCVDKMIRSSDSPCGEALMANIGQQTLNQRVKERGYDFTRFDGIVTSASDCAKVLSDIVSRKDLSDENTAFLLDAMINQDTKFKRGLATGAPGATWATKVGWNESYNYHDVGIMTLPDNRQYIVAILSQGNGSPLPIADFASTIYQALKD